MQIATELKSTEIIQLLEAYKQANNPENKNE